jgi:hypothetical protein
MVVGSVNAANSLNDCAVYVSTRLLGVVMINPEKSSTVLHSLGVGCRV